MAKRKDKMPYAIYETKEQFDRHCNNLIEVGRDKGFKEGKIWALSHVNELFEELFSPDEFRLAGLEKANRNIERWRKDKEVASLKQKLDGKRLIKEVEREAVSRD